MEEIRALVRKYTQVIQRYYVQYLSGYDAVALGQAMQVLNAQNGVEVGTEIVMRYLRKYNKPTIMVVNQLDHSKADFDKTIEDVKKQFAENTVLMQYPYKIA